MGTMKKSKLMITISETFPTVLLESLALDLGIILSIYPLILYLWIIRLSRPLIS